MFVVATLLLVTAAELLVAAWGWVRLPRQARIPVHAGFSGWDQYVGKRAGLAIHVGLSVAVVGLMIVLERRVPREAAVLTFIYLIPPLLLLGFTTAAVRHAAGGAASGPARPWIAAAFAVPAVLGLGVIAMVMLWRPSVPASVRVTEAKVVVDLHAPYPVLALRGGTSFDLDDVEAVRAEPRGRSLPLGARVGTGAPHVVAGTFTRTGCKSFVAMDDGREAVVFSLKSRGGYDRVIVEVADPAAVVAAIRATRPGVAERAGDC